ncbi:MAG: hypothetical protein ACI8QC_000027 [Planctomycetota bacterium]|jgi:hypothetical protein
MSSPSTPRIDALLGRLRGALRRQVWLHGMGTVIAAGFGWLLFTFLADRFLHVPAPVRMVHSALTIGLPVFFLWREFARPMGHIPDRRGLAVLAGRAAPEARDLIVSAVQLAPKQGQRAGSGSDELVERVVNEAEQAAQAVDLGSVLAPKGPRRRAWLGACAVVTCGLALGAQPAMTRIFIARALGSNMSWPRRTNLTVEIPLAGDRAQVEVRGDEIFVRVARGSDVPVLVRAEGVVPSEVVLRFSDGYESVLSSGGSTKFHDSLRAVQENLSFTVIGGDDTDGVPIVHLQVLQPPEVIDLAFDITPPAYTGLPHEVVFRTEAVVLEGSNVRVHVRPDPADSHGEALLFPADERLPMVAMPFPINPDTAQEFGSTDELEAAGLSFELVATNSLRFSLDLLDEGGLPNPDPGLFSIQVNPDRKPELTLIAPARAEMDVVLGGTVPLWLRLGDDFGLANASWDVRSPQDPESQINGGELALQDMPAAAPGQGNQRLRDERMAGTLLEVSELDPETPLTEGRVLILQAGAMDKREPIANTAHSAPVRLRVVSGDEFQRRLKENLARAGERATALTKLADDLVKQLDALTQSYDETDTADTEATESDFGDAEQLGYSARRLGGDTHVLARDLASLTEGLIYSRLDPRSGALLQALVDPSRHSAERVFQPSSWLAITDDYAEGRLGQADLAGDLVSLVGLSLVVSERHVPQVTEALLEASTSGTQPEERQAAAKALVAARLAQADLEALLTNLGEWDNFQSVLNLVRDILNRQTNLNQRSRSYAEDN